MDDDLSQETKHEVLVPLRRQYARAGFQVKRQLLDQSIGLICYM